MVHFSKNGKMKSSVHEYLPADHVLDGKIKRIDDAEKVLFDFLKSQKLKGSISREGNMVTVSVNTRNYEVHKRLDIGEYSDETITIVGPRSDGLLMKIQERETEAPGTPLIYYYGYSPYFHPSFPPMDQVFLSSNQGREMYVELVYVVCPNDNKERTV